MLAAAITSTITTMGPTFFQYAFHPYEIALPTLNAPPVGA
jgi:hypothetical protein